MWFLIGRCTVTMCLRCVHFLLTETMFTFAAIPHFILKLVLLEQLQIIDVHTIGEKVVTFPDFLFF